MNLLNKLTKMNLKLNKKRTIVTIIGIILSVSLITAVSTMYSSGINSLIKFEKYQFGNFHTSYFDVPMSEISKFKSNQKIENIYLTKNIGYAKIDSKNENKPYAYVKAFSKSSLENLSVKLVEGRLPERKNEIVIPTHLKTNGRVILNVGDSITLDVGKRVSDGYELGQNNPYRFSDNSLEKNSAEAKDVVDAKGGEEILDVNTKTYKIVGIIERPATNIEPYTAPGYTFITYADESDFIGNVDVYAKYTKDGVKNAYKVTANIIGIDEKLFEKANTGMSITEKELLKYNEELQKAKYKIDMNDYLLGLETDPIGASGVGGLGIVVVIVCIIIVITSVFCIKNSFDISITEKIKQYGMLRSIGATKKQIRRNVFYEASILGVIGIPLGIIFGFLASYILVIVSNLLLKDMFNGLKLIFTFSLIPVIVAILLGILTIYFSAFRSSRKASKVSPIDSIRNSANIKINPKKVKSSKIIKKIFGMGGDISYKNLKRNKKKYRTTVISIIVSVSVFIALASFINMAFDTVEDELKISEYNVSLYLYDTSEIDRLYKKSLETVNLKNIDDYAVNRYTDLYFENPRYNKNYMSWLDLRENDIAEGFLTVYTIGDYQYKKYIKKLGLNYDEIKDKGILIDYHNVARQKENKTESKYMRIYDYNVGDVINGRLKNDKDYNFEIGYVTDIKPFGLKNVENDFLIISDELFDGCCKAKIIEFLYKSSDASTLQDNIDKIMVGESYSLNNIEENVKMMNNLFTLVAIFLYGFIIVISLIGITNIFNTITTNMELRKQEFAMLKSIGMTKKEFSRMIRLESIFMGVKSLVFGLPIGIMLSYLIYHFLVGDSGMPYKLPIIAIIIVIFAVFLLITTLMKYSMNKINKQNTIETIRNENI